MNKYSVGFAGDGEMHVWLFLCMDENKLWLMFAIDVSFFCCWRQVKECQVLLFSATVPSWVRNIANKYTANPLTVDAVGKHVSTTTQCVDDVVCFHRAPKAILLADAPDVLARRLFLLVLLLPLSYHGTPSDLYQGLSLPWCL